MVGGEHVGFAEGRVGRLGGVDGRGDVLAADDFETHGVARCDLRGVGANGHLCVCVCVCVYFCLV